MFDRFSDECKHAINDARRCAVAHQSDHLDDLHLLVGVCRTPDSLAVQVLLACGQDPIAVMARAERRMASSSGTPSKRSELPFTPAAKHALEGAMHAADDADHSSLGSHHVLIGLLNSAGAASEILRNGGLSVVDATRAMYDVHNATDAADAAALDTVKRSQVLALWTAQEVCVQLGKGELAAKLYALAAELERAP